MAVALHTMTALGYAKGEQLTSDLLARSVNTNPVVIRRIVAELVRAGLVASQRGAGGGVKLARDPRQITLWDVYLAIDGTHQFCQPERPGAKQCPVGSCMRDVLSDVFSDIDRALQRQLESVTIADMVRRVG